MPLTQAQIRDLEYIRQCYGPEVVTEVETLLSHSLDESQSDVFQVLHRVQHDELNRRYPNRDDNEMRTNSD